MIARDSYQIGKTEPFEKPSQRAIYTEIVKFPTFFRMISLAVKYGDLSQFSDIFPHASSGAKVFGLFT